MKKIVYFIFFIYLFFLSFVSGFAYNSFLSISFLASLFFILFVGAQIRAVNKVNSDNAPFLLLYWILFLLSFLFFSTGDKCVNQLFMWTYAFFVYNFCFKKLLLVNCSEKDIKKKILGMLTIGLVFTSVFVIFEFVSKNVINFPIESYIPRQKLEEMNSKMILDGIRCRGLTEEPTQLGFYLLTMGPLSIYWIVNYIKKFNVRIILILLLALSVLFSFSSAAFAVALFTISMYMMFYMKKYKGIAYIILIILVILCLFSFDSDNFIIQTITSKFDSNSLSGQDRRSRFEALKYFTGIHAILGYGPAAYSTLNVSTFISLILGLLMNTGILGLVLFSLFLLSVYKDIIVIDDKFLKHSIKISFFNCCLYFIFGDVIYIPWFWIIVTFAFVFSYYSKRRKKINLMISKKSKNCYDISTINRI